MYETVAKNTCQFCMNKEIRMQPFLFSFVFVLSYVFCFAFLFHFVLFFSDLIFLSLKKKEFCLCMS